MHDDDKEAEGWEVVVMNMAKLDVDNFGGEGDSVGGYNRGKIVANYSHALDNSDQEIYGGCVGVAPCGSGAKGVNLNPSPFMPCIPCILVFITSEYGFNGKEKARNVRLNDANCFP